MITWEKNNEAALPHYLAARAAGARVEALDSRPVLPVHLHIVAQAMADLGGEFTFSDVVEWATLAGADEPGLFWLLDRLRAIRDVHRELANADKRKNQAY